MTVTKESLLGAQSMIDSIIKENCSGPILVRLAWHDAGTFDVTVTEPWPAAGGATASIRLAPEINHRANTALSIAMTQLQPVKDAYPDVSYADIYQMASARAIALAGVPLIDMKYGRLDATLEEHCSPEGNLPIPVPLPPAGKYGIVALSGAHTLGRAYPNRSGAGAAQTKYTDGSAVQKLADGTDASYKPGGSSWTTNFLVFDNSYYQVTEAVQLGTGQDAELVSLPTDMAIFADDGFRPFAERFRDSQDAFFASYAKSHKKLAELGAKFEPEGGLSL